jgi:hypothetical protein
MKKCLRTAATVCTDVGPIGAYIDVSEEFYAKDPSVVQQWHMIC